MKNLLICFAFALVSMSARSQAFTGRTANNCLFMRYTDTTGVVPAIGNNTVAWIFRTTDSTLYRWTNTHKAWTAYSTGGTATGGIYVPTVTGINFVTSVTADSATWSRSGNTVTVYGSMTVTASANNSQVNISVTLPVASLLNGGHACWGGGWTAVGNGTGITVTTYSTNHIAELSYASGAASSGIPIVLQYSFQYQIQ